MMASSAHSQPRVSTRREHDHFGLPSCQSPKPNFNRIPGPGSDAQSLISEDSEVYTEVVKPFNDARLCFELGIENDDAALYIG